MSRQSTFVKLFKPGDLLLWLTFLAGLYISWPQLIALATPATVAIVEIDGKAKYQLDLQKDTQISLSEFSLPVSISIQSGGIKVLQNNCKHKICIRSGMISRSGEMIVCVPKKILIYIPIKQKDDKPIQIITG